MTGHDGRRRSRTAGTAGALLLCACSAAAVDFDFHAPASPTGPAAAAAMKDLAQRLLPVYQEPDADRYLDNLSALQLVAGDYAAAYGSRQSLRNRRRPDLDHPLGPQVVFDLYAYARTLEVDNKVPFPDAFRRAFDTLVPRLADPDAYAVEASLESSPEPFQTELQSAMEQQRAKDNISETDAVALIWEYLKATAYRSFAPLVGALEAGDERRRYVTDGGVRIPSHDGTPVAVVIVRPRGATKPLPALFELAIDGPPGGAKEAAAHGYAGITAQARRSVPFQHDGDDARAVIAWIARQPWSDGRVAMYGGGYGGFTAWAAAAHRPRALKAIATTAPMAPGIDFPMSGGIFQTAAFGWSARVTGAAGPGGEAADVWGALDQQWYRSGRAVRDLGRIYGRPNPIFLRWLNHPSFDRYWGSMTPTHEEFAHIDIPVLTIAGYFSAGEPAALHYFAQHRLANAHADHTFIIGPYDDAGLLRGAGTPQQGTLGALRGYSRDAAALIDLHELRFQWLDHVLKGGPRPPLLTDRVNFEVMGANEWRHVATLGAMSTGPLRFQLGGTVDGGGHELTRGKTAAVIDQHLSFVDRTDAGWTAPIDLVTRNPDLHDALEYDSEPLAAAVEVDGAFSGRLDFAINKADVDLDMALYERLPDGRYIRLFDPAFELRASYARDRRHRHLLKAGARQQLLFTSERITGRRLEAGSRVVLVLGLSKRPDREINYGTGGDVGAESIADGRVPLKIRWYGASFLDIPVRKSASGN